MPNLFEILTNAVSYCKHLLVTKQQQTRTQKFTSTSMCWESDTVQHVIQLLPAHIRTKLDSVPTFNVQRIHG